MPEVSGDKLKQIADWSDLLSSYQQIQEEWVRAGEHWIFRGMGSAQYPMATSLERAAGRFGHELGDLPDLETRLLREFRRRVHHYTSDVPHRDDTMEWLALMQHYGAPTRLLDWTYSFFVAVYFAVVSAGENNSKKAGDDKCVVRGLNRDAFDSRAMLTKQEWIKARRLSAGRNHADIPLNDRPWVHQMWIIDYRMKHPRESVLAVNPLRLNQRLTIQQGVFLMPGDVSKSFEENLSAHSDLQSNLYKFEISSSASVRKEFLLNLHRMNINSATLFPGLEGFARSLQTRLACPEWMLSRSDVSSHAHRR